MALPADFSKIYGSTATGGLTPISDVDYAKGWEFVGSNPPTKNDFSYLQNLSDLKSQWLYSNKLQRTDPFGDIKSDGAEAVSTALANLGLGNLPTFGDAASKNVGTTAGTVAAGDDSRFGLMIGAGQTWRDVTSQRSLGVTYTNSTGKPIQVLLDFNRPGTSWFLNVVIDNLPATGAGGYCPVIPSGSTYRVSASGITAVTWRELR